MNRAPHASWQEIVATPPRGAHLAQLYEDDAFVAAAVSEFAAAGLRGGEGVILTGTPAHLAGARERMERGGTDVAAAIRDGRLVTASAVDGLASVVSDGRLDERLYRELADSMLARLAERGFSGLRWWGEMTNLLFLAGDRAGAIRAEALAAQAGERHGATVFCSFQCDRYHPGAYGAILPDVCATHSHLIPGRDYVRSRLAVNRAIAEVVGEIRGPLLQSLSSWKGSDCDFPSSQSVLFWLRETLPERFEAVLARARAYDDSGVAQA